MPQSNIPDCRTPLADGMKGGDKAFYLMEKDGREFLVTVTDTYLELRPLETQTQGSSFSLEGWSFIKCNYQL